MPFKKIGKDDYQSPSGRHFNAAQVRLYHAHGGRFPGQKSSEGAMNKGYTSRVESFAHGGAVLGRVKDFMKTPDEFRANKGQVDNFGKGSGRNEAPPAKGKSLAAVKPKS